MPVCKNCHTPFPNTVIIENKERYLNKRKYCLACSPWNQRAFRKLHPLTKNEIKCQFCNRLYIPKRGMGSKIKCNSCRANSQRWKKKKELILYKGGCCQICGYNKCDRNLVFHHLDPTKKEFTIGGSHCKTIEKLKEEADKCILLCHNCHGEMHDEIIKLPTGL